MQEEGLRLGGAVVCRMGAEHQRKGTPCEDVPFCGETGRSQVNLQTPGDCTCRPLSRGVAEQERRIFSLVRGCNLVYELRIVPSILLRYVKQQWNLSQQTTHCNSS